MSHPVVDRSRLTLTAVLVALALVLSIVGPAVAGDPAPSTDPPPSADSSASAPASPDPSPSSSASPDPSPSASASPDPSPWPSTSPDPSASPTPSPTATPTPSPTTASGPTALPASIVIHGRGYGHGVGMSQYGARGRALAGQDAPEILGHYFPGTTWSTIDPLTRIRVRVLEAFNATSTTPLRIYGRGGDWRIDGATPTFPASAQLKVWRTTVTTATGTTSVWRLRVTSSTGLRLYSGTRTTSFRIRPASNATALQLYSKPSLYDRYRGTLRVVLKSRLDVVNEVGLEEYLRGVVPVEMPASWPAAALRAQTVAARSYAARRLRTTGTYDVFDDTRSQVYRGILAEKSATNAAIAATAGVVLRYGSTIASTFFHSSAGGATEANENVWVSSTGAKVAGPLPYLRSRPDRAPDGTAYDAAATWYTWSSAAYSPAQLSAILANDTRTNVGTLTAIDQTRRGPSGRLIAVTLIGSEGTKTVSGDVFRIVFNRHRPTTHPILRSTLFAVGAPPP